MTSYIVTIEIDHHRTCIKMRPRDKQTAHENVRCWCFILKEKLRKTSEGDGNHLPPFASKG